MVHRRNLLNETLKSIKILIHIFFRYGPKGVIGMYGHCNVTLPFYVHITMDCGSGKKHIENEGKKDGKGYKAGNPFDSVFLTSASSS